MTDQAFTPSSRNTSRASWPAWRPSSGPLALGTGGSAPPDPTDLQRAAQDRTVAAGGKLVPEEEAKRKKNPLDRFGEISAWRPRASSPRARTSS